MDRRELRLVLEGSGIRPEAYYVADAPPDPLAHSERLILERSIDGWNVWYAERGLRTSERHFDTEAEACSYMLDQLVRDPTTH